MASRLKRAALLALPLSLLAACSSSPEKPQDRAPDSSTTAFSEPSADEGSLCDADPVHDLIGQQLDDELAVEARDRADARFLRITRPNQPGSMDYHPQRLNIAIDQDGVVLQVSCG